MSQAHSQAFSAGRSVPTTANSAERDWSDGESDEDPGMFSFLRPQTGISSPTSPRSRAPPTATSSTPYSPGMFAASPDPSSAPTTMGSSLPLSPAAAYALASKRGTDTANSPAPTTFNIQMPTPGERQPSESSLKDENALWAPTTDGSSGVGLDVDNGERGYQMQEYGGAPLRPTRSQDEKMLAEFGGYSGYGMPGFDDFDFEEEDSPFPEVRASVSNIDDPDMPCLSFRVWFLGILFAIVVTAANTFFYFRYPSPFITPIIVQIIAYPAGKLLAGILPVATWDLPKWMQRLGAPEDFSFNPGPFNIKEHTALVIIANIATGPAFTLNFITASGIFYGRDFGAGFEILLLVCCQMIGFGVAGLCRRFLVFPAAMIWPQNLVYCTLLNTLHAESEDFEEEGQGLTRTRFFLWVFGGAFCWYWLPGFLFQALSAFSFVCWIAPNNVIVNQLFGVASGLGMSMITFDWAQISYIGSPLVVPWWAQVNIFSMFVVVFWLVVPILYYNDVWYSSYMPLLSASVFDRFGAPYNTSRVLNPETLTLNVTEYQSYSPLYLPVSFAMLYGVYLMLAIAAVVHTALYFGKDIVARARKVHKAEDDIHMKLMKQYPEVPDWWYLIVTVVVIGISIGVVAAWDTQMPIWALLVSIAIGFLYILPSGFIFAMTAIAMNINLLVQLIGGYMIPGLPLANGCITSGLTFVQDLKLGHYMKIPPRSTFAVQFVSTIVGSLVQVGVKRWLAGNIEGFCRPGQGAGLSCPPTRQWYSSTVVWGVIGPARLFGHGKLYNAILYFLLIGAVLPLLTWLLAKKYPKSWVRFINIPVALAGCQYIPPITGINYSSWFLFGFIFQFIMRRKFFQIWSKFNFVLSAGLDAGTGLSLIIIFFALYLPKNGTIFVNWWGNTVFTETLDFQGVSYKAIPEEGFFGMSEW
ncbi:hypothetical protein OIO90_002878 [Microbotryomycetes sp. JL221]|nr:hypothetical protein OIO90_002878 [Microbotryomycetes sp. JL221]